MFEMTMRFLISPVGVFSSFRQHLLNVRGKVNNYGLTVFQSLFSWVNKINLLHKYISKVMFRDYIVMDLDIVSHGEANQGTEIIKKLHGISFTINCYIFG